MQRSRLRFVLPVLATALLASGCAEVADSAQQAANSAASQVASDVAATARAEAVKAICAPIKDGAVSAADLQVLGGWVLAAEESGVPAAIADPLKQIAAAGDKAPATAVAALGQGCEDAVGQ